MKHICHSLLLLIICSFAKGQPNSIVRNIEQDRNGIIWITSWEGMFRYDGKSFTNITTQVTSERFFSVLEDREGNLWFGTIGGGVFLYDGETFQNFTIKEGLLNNDVGCIYEDRKGDIWFGVFGGASRYDGISFRNYIINGDAMSEDRTGKTFPERPPYEVTSIMEDKSGKLWLSTRGSTFVYDGKRFTVLTNAGKSFTNVRCIIEDKRGNIWLGGNDGLWRYDGHAFTNFTQMFVGYMYEDRKGNLWTSAGGKGGDWRLSRYGEKSLSSQVVVDPEIIKGSEGMVFGIFEAADGSIWFGTGDGVRQYDGVNITTFRTQN